MWDPWNLLSSLGGHVECQIPRQVYFRPGRQLMKSRIYVGGPKVHDFQDIAFQLANWGIENYAREFDCNSPFIMAAKLSVQPSGSKIEPRKVLSFVVRQLWSILILTLSQAYHSAVGLSLVRWHSWWCRSSSDGERSALFILLDHSLMLLVSI